MHETDDNPIHKLMVAVLLGALNDLRYVKSKTRKLMLLAIEARSWFYQSEHGVFSFDVIATELGLDAEAIRTKLDEVQYIKPARIRGNVVRKRLGRGLPVRRPLIEIYESEPSYWA